MRIVSAETLAQSTAMDAGNSITAAVFVAFLKCPTKAHLLAIGEPPPDNFFADINLRISSMYKAAVKQRLGVAAEVPEILDFGQPWPSLPSGGITHYVDCETAVYDFAPPLKRRGARQPHEPSPSDRPLPVLFFPWDKPKPSDCLLVCFGALSLSRRTGMLPDTGILIYGDSHRRRTVKIGDYVARARQTIAAIEATCHGREPPPLILNRHCAVSDFQPRCRVLAIERDDLSLLTAMTGKERAKCNAKGIFTVTQLSYGYRPRRRKRTRPDVERSTKSTKRVAPAARNDHKLKALAIKKRQIHVVGAPSMKFDGASTFIDVEGMPDRDFYYLVGLRFECDGEQVERSFWADGLEGERAMWENCLRTLKAIGNAQIVSYGAYEARFLRQMKQRYVSAAVDVEFVDRLIETSVNLVACMYSKIYFPKFSNSLKEVGRYLGFEWTWPRASGAAAPLLRRAWELGADDGLKRKLIGYNMDDCRAAATVADVLVRICAGGSASGLDAVNVGSLEVGFQRTFGKLDCALPEFKKINDAAYWDYQRSKVYARLDKVIRRTVRKSQNKSKRITVEQEVTVADRPDRCPNCNAARLWTYRGGSHVVYDLKFTRRGIKRWAVRYRYSKYRCSDCRADMTL